MNPADQVPATAQLRAMASGYRITQAIHVVAVLGIADLVGDASRSADHLAVDSESDAGALRRVLQALAAEGVFVEDEEGQFANNELSRALTSDAPGSLRSYAMFIGADYHWETWGNLLHSVRTGENAFNARYGTGVWSYRADKPELSAVFDAFMKSNTETAAAAVVSAYDFSAARTVVDVAGGTGALLGAVLEANPGVSGVVFDQPVVIDQADEVNRDSAWASRCEFVAGSMFESVPANGDVYMLKSIVHVWPDADAVTILSRCREAMDDTATVLVIERLLEGPNRAADTKFSDLNMMVMLGGRERTAAEFADLCQQAGLRLQRTIPTSSPWVVLEAVKA
ncbi:MAG: methyltransferase [Nocardioidaceae bacterium]